MLSRKWVLSAFVLLFALPFAACSKTLNTDAVETEISSGIEEQTELTVDSVDCPDGVEPKAGDTFECTAETDRGTLTITVTQDDDEGNVRWEVTSAEQ